MPLLTCHHTKMLWECNDSWNAPILPPHLSYMTNRLRELPQKETEWIWDQPQQGVPETLKQAAASDSVLRNYNLKEEVCVTHLGAAMMQDGQQVAYTSRALTPAETRCAQIKKELFAIVYAFNQVDAYIYTVCSIHV